MFFGLAAQNAETHDISTGRLRYVLTVVEAAIVCVVGIVYVVVFSTRCVTLALGRFLYNFVATNVCCDFDRLNG